MFADIAVEVAPKKDATRTKIQRTKKSLRKNVVDQKIVSVMNVRKTEHDRVNVKNQKKSDQKSRGVIKVDLVTKIVNAIMINDVILMISDVTEVKDQIEEQTGNSESEAKHQKKGELNVMLVMKISRMK